MAKPTKTTTTDERQTVLHVGCGAPNAKKLQRDRAFPESEWREVRLDIDAGVEPDIVASMTDMAEVEGDAYDAIYSSHNIEHLYAHEVPVALREFSRVLKPDGFAVLTCPDVQSVAALVAEGKLEDAAYVSPAGPITPLDMMYGHRASMAKGNLYMAHRTGFTLKTLANALISNGFAQAIGSRVAPEFALWVIGFMSKQDEAEVEAHRAAMSTRPRGATPPAPS